MAQIKTYMPYIQALYYDLEKRSKSSEWENDEEIIKRFSTYRDWIRSQIHDVLDYVKTEKNEQEIREIISKYVIGYADKKKKTAYIGAIPLLEGKVAQLSTTFSKKRNVKEEQYEDIKKKLEYKNAYEQLLDDFMALAAFRSMKHYYLYMQKVFGITLWEDTLNCFEGYFYYGGRMVLDGEVKFIEKQCPTGYGKCALPTTMVRTPKGITTLENIEVGDEVYSMDRNELVVQKVTNKWYTRKKQVKIKTRGGIEITISPEHRMYTQRGYVKAEDLSCDDYMYRLCKPYCNNTNYPKEVAYNNFVWEGIISIEFIDETTDMIDIEVENTHNFIANDLVSHNSLSDAFMQSWIFGIDIDNDVLKICGNDKFTDDSFQNVVRLMVSPQFAKVFPYYAQFNCKESDMFVYCARKDLKFCIKGSTKPTNFRIATKLSNVNGVRAKFLFLDDITQREDMSKIAKHNDDIHRFTHEWFERNYNRNLFFLVASGTTYSRFDILSHLNRVMGGEDAKKSSINKYTHIAKSDYIVPDGTSVFVCVPLLDYETDESTFPKKISTISARKKRDTSPEEFWAMDMQKPLPPEDSPFYFTNLRQYEVLPSIGECGRTDCCYASLDPKRRGGDYLSMPIFFEAQDPDREEETAHFLVDWLYENRTMKECIPLIASKIIHHHITRLYVERNTEECIEKIITDELAKHGYYSCVIDEVYSTEPKDKRIMNAEGDIKHKLIFPKYGMYAPSSNVGKAMMDVYGYNYDRNVKHDDAPDSLALYCRRFVSGKFAKNKKAKLLYL